MAKQIDFAYVASANQVAATTQRKSSASSAGARYSTGATLSSSGRRIPKWRLSLGDWLWFAIPALLITLAWWWML